MYVHAPYDSLDRLIDAGLRTGFGDDWVRLGAVKLFADGSISERTALLSRPYIGLGNYRGVEATSRKELYQRARKAHLAGWQIATHANGDVAIDRALSVYEQLQQESPRRDPRFRLEHCTVVNADLIGRMKRIGAIPIPWGAYVYFFSTIMHFYGAER